MGQVEDWSRLSRVEVRSGLGQIYFASCLGQFGYQVTRFNIFFMSSPIRVRPGHVGLLGSGRIWPALVTPIYSLGKCQYTWPRIEILMFRSFTNESSLNRA